ncbi:MAG: hypothetical protein ACREF9_08695, partial [Opitutaceae bacterium]
HRMSISAAMTPQPDSWMVPGHYDFPNATRLRARFEQLCEDMLDVGEPADRLDAGKMPAEPA